MEDEIRESSLVQRIGKIAGLLLFIAVLLAPTPEGLTPAGQRLAAVLALMAALWGTQAIPIAATSLIPLVAFPVLGIQSATVVSKSYMSKEIFLFFGGFVIALGIEKWGLHRRMALTIVRAIGASPRRVVLGFMSATAFLSMWISNTAATLMMLPIALAMVTALREVLETNDGEPQRAPDSPGGGGPREGAAAALAPLATVLMLGIAYAASIGGFTTLVGTPTNVSFRTIWSNTFTDPDAPTITTGSWVIATLPIGVAYLLCAWAYLTWRLPKIPGAERFGREFFTNRLRALGRMTSAERRIFAVFLITALLWIFRTPLEFGPKVQVPGWLDGVAWFTAPSETADTPSARAAESKRLAEWIDDSTVAIAMALLLFLIPSGTRDKGRTRYLMDWQSVEGLPWGILLLFGGGLALAEGFKSTELAQWLGDRFALALAGAPPWVLVAGACLLMTFLTEFTSNVATLNATLPVMIGAAVSLEVDPRLVAIPATIATSCAFMLPIATPPNAIIFGSGKVRVGQMVRAGFALNLFGVVLLTLATFLLLIPQMGIKTDSLPDWAKPPNAAEERRME
ncbi:MAG: SLC13 family permease [Planctomycetaceae bacterium]